MADFWAWLAGQLDSAKDLGITEREFWNMTPRQLFERAEFHTRREQREWKRAAWMVHHITAAFVGSEKAPSVDTLLGLVTKG